MHASDESVQSYVADEVNRRLEKATQDLQNKYSTNSAAQETSADGPTGAAYKEKHLQEQRKLKEKKRAEQARNVLANENSSLNRGDEDDDEDDDEDVDLREIRQSRLRQIKAETQTKNENLAKGHGQYREISQDEFLKEVTTSTRVVCHFYHRDFPRCIIMDHHIGRLCARHIETKFIKIDASKAPFFVDKLKIKTIPSVILFVDGVASNKILGFEGLADGLPEGHEDEWPTIRLARLLATHNMIDNEKIVDDDDAEREMKNKMEELRKNMYSRMTSVEVDDDFDD